MLTHRSWQSFLLCTTPWMLVACGAFQFGVTSSTPGGSEGSPAGASEPAQASAPAQPEPAEVREPTFVVDEDFPELASASPYDPAAVEQAFAKAPPEMLRVTKVALRDNAHQPPTGTLARTAEALGKRVHGMVVHWERCHMGHDICLDTRLAEPLAPLPAGVPGLVWTKRTGNTSVLFVTMDGGVYAALPDELDRHTGGSGPEHALDAGLDLGDIERLQKAEIIGSVHLSAIEAARAEVKACIAPIDKKWDDETAALDRQNILSHAKEARQEVINERFDDRVNTTCRKQLDAAMDAFGAAMDELAEKRRALVQRVQSKRSSTG